MTFIITIIKIESKRFITRICIISCQKCIYNFVQYKVGLHTLLKALQSIQQIILIPLFYFP